MKLWNIILLLHFGVFFIHFRFISCDISVNQGLDKLPLGSSFTVPTLRNDSCYQFKLQDQINLPKLSVFQWQNSFENRPFLVFQTQVGSPRIVGWYVLNEPEEERYVESDIVSCKLVGSLVDLDVMERKGVYFAFASINSENNTAVSALDTPVDPSPSNFHINEKDGHKGLGVVFRLERKDPTVSVIRQFNIRQVLHADAFGPIEKFNLHIGNNERRQAALFTIQNFQPSPKVEGLIYSFLPSNSQEVDDESVRFFQSIPLTSLPKTTSLQIEGLTSLVLAEGSQLNFWNHVEGDGQFVFRNSLFQPNIKSIDSITDAERQSYLFAASGRSGQENGRIQIYKWSTAQNTFIWNNVIEEPAPLQIRAFRQMQNDQLFLIVLTEKTIGDNVQVYVRQVSGEWVKITSFNSEGSDLMDATSFIYNGRIRTQILLPNTANGVNVVEIQVVSKQEAGSYFKDNSATTTFSC